MTTTEIPNYLEGASAGMISLFLTYPLISISTRMQIQQKKKKDKERESVSFLKTLSTIQYEEGLFGFYNALFGIALTNGVYYYFYESIKAAIEQQRKLTPLLAMFCGAVAGSMTVLMTNPIWVINTRLTTGQGLSSRSDSEELMPKKKKEKSIGAFELLIKMIKEEGIGSLWQGIWPALILVSNPSIQYMVFEMLKIKLNPTKPIETFWIGAVSKLIATFMTYPYIVIKSRMQTGKKELQNTTTVQALSQIIRDEGVGGLFKGIGSKLVQSVLTAAILLVAKDESEKRVRQFMLWFILFLTKKQ